MTTKQIKSDLKNFIKVDSIDDSLELLDFLIETRIEFLTYLMYVKNSEQPLRETIHYIKGALNNYNLNNRRQLNISNSTLNIMAVYFYPNYIKNFTI